MITWLFFLLALLFPTPNSARVAVVRGIGAGKQSNHHDLVNPRDTFTDDYPRQVATPRKYNLNDVQMRGGPFGVESTRTHRNDLNAVQKRDDCVPSPLDELYAIKFIEEKLEELVRKEHCWLNKGVSGLKQLLQQNLTTTPLLNLTVPTCPFDVSSADNTFTIDLSGESYMVNGVEETVFVVLTSIHLGCMITAFFIIYPIVLVFACATVLCELIDRPLYRAKIDKWVKILQLAFFLPLVTIGMICGVIGMGTAEHFQSEHGLTGLISVILAAIAVPLYFYDKYFRHRLDLATRLFKGLKFVSYADTIVCQSILLVSSFASPDGIDDLAKMTLCGTNIISTSLAFSLGMTVAFIWNSAMAAMTVQWWLVRRVNADKAEKNSSKWLLKIFRRSR